jgi:O-antigen ligase
VTNRIGFRAGVACLAALSAGLSIAIISISKVVLVLGALFVLLKGEQQVTGKSALQGFHTPRLVLWVLLAFSLSLFWTSAPMSNALGAMGKYGKLLVIPAFLVMIRTQREAVWVLSAFLTGQIFLLVSSWLLYFQVPLIWATSNMATSRYAVFSSYLDQGIMSGTVAAIFWHLRTLAPSRFLRFVAIGLSLLALGGVFVVFVGRSGYLVAVAMVSLAFLWALPRRYRFAAMVMPPLVIMFSVLSFENVAQRFAFTKAEISAYSAGSGAATSTDNRLDFWRGSVEAIVQKPLTGAGVGSWTTEYNRIEALKHPGHKDLNPGGNPHQEFLLWGVQLGAAGIALLLAFLGAVVLDFLKFDPPIARAGQSVVVALAVSCLFNSSIFDAYIGDFFCLSIGVLLAYGVRTRQNLPTPSSSISPNSISQT